MTTPVSDSIDGKPFLVVSDLHLGPLPLDHEAAFRAFLAHATATASGLLINGDLFDVWLATRRFVITKHVRVLAAIADVVDAGIPVYFVGGNHDALEFGGDTLQRFGMTLLTEPARLQLGAWRALVIHGDGVPTNGPSYPRYSKRHPLLRHRAFRWSIQRLLHVDRIHDGIAAWSGTAKYVESHQLGESTGPKPAAAPLEAWARGALGAEPNIDIVLAGHSHLPALIEIEPGRYYLNSGDWISHMTYGVLPTAHGTPELRLWPVR